MWIELPWPENPPNTYAQYMGTLDKKKKIYVHQIELFDYLNCVQTNDLCSIEFLEIELFDHLIVCNQMTVV